MAHLLDNVIAGIDQLTLEPNPKLDKNEPSGNAYHYVLQKINHEKYPYILNGPIRDGTMIDHWFDDSDLNVYLNTGEDE